ncbi:hypothetical protein C8R45DRAFT_602201 [Mycena sanguinolenta]|nr:hypothetical protein C8R45DRAFT_602201 [Mycena sanguinolenta]
MLLSGRTHTEGWVVHLERGKATATPFPSFPQRTPCPPPSSPTLAAFVSASVLTFPAAFPDRHCPSSDLLSTPVLHLFRITYAPTFTRPSRLSPQHHPRGPSSGSRAILVWCRGREGRRLSSWRAGCRCPLTMKMGWDSETETCRCGARDERMLWWTVYHPPQHEPCPQAFPSYALADFNLQPTAHRTCLAMMLHASPSFPYPSLPTLCCALSAIPPLCPIHVISKIVDTVADPAAVPTVAFFGPPNGGLSVDPAL